MSKFGNNPNDLDIPLPEEKRETDSEEERRKAIAQARAIRRDAAALETGQKKDAEAEALAILENAQNKPKRPRKPIAPHAVHQEQGKFEWLDDVKQSADSPPHGSVVDSILARIHAEDAESERPAHADVDAILTEIENDGQESVNTHAADLTDKPLSERLPANEDSVSQTGEIETESIEQTLKTVVMVPISPEEDPLARARAAEIARGQEKMQAAEHAAAMKDAAEQFAAQTKDARGAVKRLSRRSEKTFRREASMERAKFSRRKIDRAAAVCNVSILMVMLFGITAAMLLLERPTVSEIENRNLAVMPEFSIESYLSGEYTDAVALYYNDTPPYRSTLKNITAKVRQFMGLRQDSVLHGSAPLSPQTETDATQTATTTENTAMNVTTQSAATETTAAPVQTQKDTPDANGEISNNILIANKRGIMLYGGGFKNGEQYAKSLNAYQQQLGDSVQVYSMVIPTPCSFYTPENFKHLIGSEYDNIEHINENLSGVKPVDVYSALSAHTEEPIYMRTDHHWSALGAFYAAQEFSKTARVPFAPISEYDKVTKPGYVGTLYGWSDDIILKENPEDFFYYVPRAPYTTTYSDTDLSNEREGKLLINLDNVAVSSWYLVYMGTDQTVTHVRTEVKNGRTLAIFKDSFGNALVPWFTSSFENIYVIDIRYFEPNAVSYLKQIGATDVLFALNSFSATGGNQREIEKLRTQ